jgi:type I restriction enzyme S subunit
MIDLFESRSSNDPTFTQLRDDPNLAEQRAFINRLFNDHFEPYADEHFVSNFPLECLSRFWELYLGCALRDRGFKLVSRENRSAAGGPDFCIEQNGSHLWIEAVVPNIGSGLDSLPLKEVQPPDRLQPDPEDQIILRYCSAIRDKYCGHLRHLNQGLVSARDPFIIAINGAGIPFKFWDDSSFLGEIPYAVRAVLPVGRPFVVLSATPKQVVKEGFEHQPFIVKLSGSRVPKDIFLDCTFSMISGLLFVNSHPFSCTALEVGNFSLLHNYLAFNKVPEGWLGSGIEWRLKPEGDKYVLTVFALR